MTEQEAQLKRCVVFVDNPHNHRCVGSACMAWQWHATTSYTGGTRHSPPAPGEVVISGTLGYCGMVARQ